MAIFVSKKVVGKGVNCGPYNFSNNAIIIGDAAHAMVPFYGQGMNAGFEDCLLLNRLLCECSWDLTTALEKFSLYRQPDAHAICDLAMYNYIEMRDLVTKKSFLWRNRLDNTLYWLFPRLWVPLYNSVTFTNMRYSVCNHSKLWQDKMIRNGLKLTYAMICVALIFPLVHWKDYISTSFRHIKLPLLNE